MYSVSERFLIKLFFTLLTVCFLLIFIISFTFNINDSVSFNSGEILPETPQHDYNAPFESYAEKIFVREGQKVNAGDTLLILANEQVRKNYEEAQTIYDTALEENEATTTLISITSEKIENLKKERELNAAAHISQKEKLTRDLESADQKVELNRQKLMNVGLTKLKMDSTLFRDQLISKLEMTNSYDAYLNYRNGLLEVENARDQIQSNLNSVEDEFRKTQNLLDFKLIELHERQEELKKAKAVSDKDLKTALENLKFYRDEARKQFVISELDGEVMNMFNLRYSQNFVTKGDHLLSVVPARDKFYARVIIPQSDLRYVKVGQEAHLKFDAFNVYENGILKGTVSYVPERKPKEDFFAIVDLSPQPDFVLKAGYSVKGEIIIERLKIYRYIAKKLFKKFENGPQAVEPSVQ